MLTYFDMKQNIHLVWMRLDCDAGSEVQACANGGHPVHHGVLPMKDHLYMEVWMKSVMRGSPFSNSKFKTLLGAEAVRAWKSEAILSFKFSLHCGRWFDSE